MLGNNEMKRDNPRSCGVTAIQVENKAAKKTRYQSVRKRGSACLGIKDEATNDDSI